MDGEENVVQLLTGSNSPLHTGTRILTHQAGGGCTAMPFLSQMVALLTLRARGPGSCVEAPPDELRELSAKPRPRHRKRSQRVGLMFALALNTVPRKWPQSSET